MKSDKGTMGIERNTNLARLFERTYTRFLFQTWNQWLSFGVLRCCYSTFCWHWLFEMARRLNWISVSETCPQSPNMWLWKHRNVNLLDRYSLIRCEITCWPELLMLWLQFNLPVGVKQETWSRYLGSQSERGRMEIKCIWWLYALCCFTWKGKVIFYDPLTVPLYSQIT